MTKNLTTDKHGLNKLPAMPKLPKIAESERLNPAMKQWRSAFQFGFFGTFRRFWQFS
jgi:hypothetical protein